MQLVVCNHQLFDIFICNETNPKLIKVMKISHNTNSSTTYFEYAIPNDWKVCSIKVFGLYTSLHITHKNPFKKIKLVSFDSYNYNQPIGGVPPITRIDLRSYVYDVGDLSCCILAFSLQANV